MEGKNVLASITGNVPVIEEGEKGAKGATERPRSWDEIPDGSAIESGTGNEQWIDIVLYGDDWYQCIRSFTKGNGVLPTNTIYFKVITDYKRLATGLFLASKAYIHNLGVDNVLITDQGEGKGNVMLKADKYGIVCKSGTFEDVTVKGNVNSVSGYVGNFTIENGSIKYTSAEKTCELCKDYVQYVDVTNNQSLYFGYGDSGVKAELRGKDSDNNDMTCKMVVAQDELKRKQIGLVTEMSGFRSKLAPNELYIGDLFKRAIMVNIYRGNSISIQRYSVPVAGIGCYIDSENSSMKLVLKGIRSGSPTGSVRYAGEIYEENGFLKIYKGV